MDEISGLECPPESHYMSKRIKVIDIEWDEPLQDVTDIGGYDALQALVRVRGTPIGYVALPAAGEWITAGDLREAVLDQHQAALERLMQSTDAVEYLMSGIDGRDSKVYTPSSSYNQAVTVAVCTRDNAEDLALTLDALKLQDYPDLDLLVVDNAPATSQTARLVFEEYPSVRYVHEPRPGLNWARNRAILEARGEIIAFTDDDVVVDEGWVAALTAAFVEDDEIGATTGLVVPLELETCAQIFFERYGGFGCGFERRRYSVCGGRNGQTDYFPGAWAECGTGASMAFRRNVFDRVGLFDPALDAGTVTNGGGDVEMFYRVLQNGYALQYEPGAIARHRHRRGYEQLRKQIESWGSGFYASLFSSARSFPDQRIRLMSIGIRQFWTQAQRLLRSLMRSPGFPPDLILAELRGALVGGIRYAQARKFADDIRRTYGRVSSATSGKE